MGVAAPGFQKVNGGGAASCAISISHLPPPPPRPLPHRGGGRVLVLRSSALAPGAGPMPARGGALYRRVRGKPAAIVPFLKGMSVRRPSVAHCREAGRGLALLHKAADGFAQSRVNDLGQPFWAGMFEGHEAGAE